MIRMSLTALLCSLVLVGCAGGPRYDTSAAARSLTPQAAAANPSAVGQAVVWGGRIIAVRPGEADTELELLAFPLRSNQQPNVSGASQGRFLVSAPMFLEPGDWAPGRLVTVSGTLAPGREGQIGQAAYRYPVVTSGELYLWPSQSALRGADGSPRFSFGIGIMLSR